jgi:hypothetical protein
MSWKQNLETAGKRMDFAAIVVGIVSAFFAVAVTRWIVGPDASTWFGASVTAAGVASNVTLQRRRDRLEGLMSPTDRNDR